MTPPFTGAVLAGGASRRMGRDKAGIELADGRTMVERAIDALRDAGAAEVVVVGGAAQVVDRRPVQHVADSLPGEGPLAAIADALDAAGREVVMVLACDLLHPSPSAIRTVLDALGPADVAIPVEDDVDQVLHSAWRRACRETVRGSLASGDRSVVSALRGLRVARVTGLEREALADADTPDELP